MTQLFYYAALFFAKVLDTTINTSKTIFIQRNKRLLASLTVIVADFIYFTLVRNILRTDNNLAILVVAIAGGVGCCLAITLSSRFSRDKTYINVIMSDDKAAMQKLRDFLAEHHITNVAADSYTKDWNVKTITLTVYAETKAQSQLINDYLASSQTKFKRMIQKM